MRNAEKPAYTVAVRVKPGASRTKVGGGYDGALGPALVVSVSARAVDGKATEAALRAVAEALGVSPRSVSLRSGHTSRDKLLLIENPPDGLAERLSRLRGGGTAT